VSAPVRPVIGPLWVPASTSGVTFSTCTHVAPDSCPRCSGDAEDAYQERRAHRAPGGKPMTAAEVARLVEACRPTTHVDTERSGAA
jgi:hypothetical protein